MNTGIYNFTVYFAIPRRDPLLLATVLSFTVTHFKRGDRNLPVDFTRVEVHPIENQVLSIHSQVHFFKTYFYDFLVMYNYFRFNFQPYSTITVKVSLSLQKIPKKSLFFMW